jgi:SAM-dependent methyltransferase
MEIGVGDGAVSLEMSKYVYRVYALDVSDELLSRINPPPNFEFRLFNGLELPFPDNSIDIAYSNDVLEHLHPEDACDQLTSLLRVLRPGGKYICITPNRLSGPHDISSHFDEVATGFHLKEYTVGELCALFRGVGFSKVETFLTVKGRWLTPPVTSLPFELIERMIAQVPRAYGRRIAGGLAAVKVVATK